MNADELKQLAAQLGRPEGDAGITVAHMMHETNIGMTRHAIEHLHIAENTSVLELGHGNCSHLGLLMTEESSVTYYGLEISELMHQEAKQINRGYVAEGRASFHMYDGHTIPFPEHFFDRIFTVNTIYFWPEPEKTLAELFRVLRPGGMLNITFAHKSFMQQLPFTPFGFRLYDQEDLLQVVAATAFRYESSDTMTEIIRSKAGDTVTRAFSTVTLFR